MYELIRSYLLINGLDVSAPVQLAEDKRILPTRWQKTSDLIKPVVRNEMDFAIACLFLPRVLSQLEIDSDDPKEAAITAWNGQWDILLLSSLLNCFALANLQSSLPLEELSPDGELRATNYHCYGAGSIEARSIGVTDSQWIEQNFAEARQLASSNDEFLSAVHALSSYRWHTHPRIQLAILWAGIEGLFKIDSELSFRISLYIARFLEPDSEVMRGGLFERVKTLYSVRSKAVHGSKLKFATPDPIKDSAEILWRLLRRCVTEGKMPNVKTLVP